MDTFLILLGILYFIFFLLFKMVLLGYGPIKFKDVLGSVVVAIGFTVSYFISDVIYSWVSSGLGKLNQSLSFQAQIPAILTATWIGLMLSFYYWEGIQRKSSLVNLVLITSIVAFVVAEIISKILSVVF